MRLTITIFILSFSFLLKSQTTEEILKQQADFYKTSLINAVLSNEQKARFVNKLIDISFQLEDTIMLINSFKHAGQLCVESSNFDCGIINYFKALDFAKSLQDTSSMADILYDIGAVYKEKNVLDSALHYCKNSLSFDSLLNRNMEMGNTYNLIGLILFEQHNYDESIKNYNKAKHIFQQFMNSEGLGLIYANLGFLYQKIEEYGMASENFIKASKYLDVHKNQLKYATLLNGIHNANGIIIEMELKRQKTARRFLIVVLILSIVVIIVVSRSYYLKHKTSKIILHQKNKIEYQAYEISESIKYAKRIQEAILVNTRKIKTILPDSFVFYRPKDIVSGDFYWFHDNDKYTIIAAVDCTGHGIPGAFVSIMGNSHLNRIIDTNDSLTAGTILMQLDCLTKSGLEKQNDKIIEDGMDIALCLLNKKSHTLEYAGANNPLICIENNQLQKIKADRFPIGGSFYEHKKFNNHVIPLNGTEKYFYVFSDGFQDQFGGENKKKYMSKKFQNLLLSIHDKSFEEQEIIMEETLSNWKGELEQTDDILVIGFKII